MGLKLKLENDHGKDKESTAQHFAQLFRQRRMLQRGTPQKKRATKFDISSYTSKRNARKVIKVIMMTVNTMTTIIIRIVLC